MRSSAESFARPWRGVLAKGEALSPADFRFFGSEGGYQGIFWGRALTPIALSDVQLGRSVHFEIPQMGVFDGTSSGETMEGRFRDGTGGGSFTLEAARLGRSAQRSLERPGFSERQHLQLIADGLLVVRQKPCLRNGCPPPIGGSMTAGCGSASAHAVTASASIAAALVTSPATRGPPFRAPDPRSRGRA